MKKILLLLSLLLLQINFFSGCNEKQDIVKALDNYGISNESNTLIMLAYIPFESCEGCIKKCVNDLKDLAEDTRIDSLYCLYANADHKYYTDAVSNTKVRFIRNREDNKMPRELKSVAGYPITYLIRNNQSLNIHDYSSLNRINKLEWLQDL